MDKTNIELFKQALIEGINRRIDRDIAACEENVVCSRKHNKAMARILKGKTPSKPINRKMIAILVAASILLLAGCAIIYHDEIRGFLTDVSEFFVKVTFDEGESEIKQIEEVYELTYVPNDYTLEEQTITSLWVQYIFEDEKGNVIRFIQQPLDASNFYIDSEHDYDNVFSLDQYTIYYRQTNGTYSYIWNDGKYALKLNSTNELSLQELEMIINGIKVK